MCRHVVDPAPEDARVVQRVPEGLRDEQVVDLRVLLVVVGPPVGRVRELLGEYVVDVGDADERSQRGAVRRVVEVARDDYPVLLQVVALQELRDSLGLALPPGVARRLDPADWVAAEQGDVDAAVVVPVDVNVATRSVVGMVVPPVRGA